MLHDFNAPANDRSASIKQARSGLRAPLIMTNPSTSSSPPENATQLGEIRNVHIPPVGLPGILHVPRAACGLVAFAHGSGSSRLSPRNTAVANALNRHSFATLLFDLLTPAEEADRSKCFRYSAACKSAGRRSAMGEWASFNRQAFARPVRSQYRSRGCTRCSSQYSSPHRCSGLARRAA